MEEVGLVIDAGLRTQRGARVTERAEKGGLAASAAVTASSEKVGEPGRSRVGTLEMSILDQLTTLEMGMAGSMERAERMGARRG